MFLFFGVFFSFCRSIYVYQEGTINILLIALSAPHL